MLLKLTVRNYALIKELDLTLENGLTIITGETGAGKSILLGALSLILGSRADSSVLLDKNEKCIVEGIFRTQDYDLETFFNENDLDFETNTILRREINPAGKSRAFINDTPVTVNLMKELGDRLIDIHSQHQVLMLNNSAFQLDIIDSFAGTGILLNEYQVAYNKYKRQLKKYNELKEQTEKNKSDLEFYEFQLNQLEEAKLREGEQEELERDQELLEHAGEIKQALIDISQLFSGEGRSVLSILGEIKSIITRISNYLPPEHNIPERIESSFIELDDISDEILRLEHNTEADPDRLKMLNERLDYLYSLIQKHRLNNLEELIHKKEEITSIIKEINTGDENLSEIAKEVTALSEHLNILSEEISEKRKASLAEIETRITELLKQLGIPNARFKIVLSSTGNFTQTGVDAADFLFSANKQIQPENIARIASGGELSRVMLSLKSMMTKSKKLPTIIFDEIDAGVSGEVADMVGKILAGMGKYMQVINITHLPQVASRGTKHYHVFKEDTGESTITRIKLLSEGERILEVARLLSGSEVTETAVKNAEELIKAGSRLNIN